MSVRINKKTIQRIIDEGWNRGNLEVLDELISPDFVNHTASEPRGSREAFKQRIQAIRIAFPDWKMSVEDMFAQGDKVVTRWRARGTHLGPLGDIPVTGKVVEVTGITVDRLVDGKRVESWMQCDVLGLMQQLGVLEA
jgi:steroid delta-isomerase-like uncharacterized protein